MSPDGKYVLSTPADLPGTLYPVDGSAPIVLASHPGDRNAGWSADGQEIFMFSRNELPVKVYRLNWRTGRRTLMREIMPSDSAGIDSANAVEFTPDGQAYVYTCLQQLSELHLVQGLK